MFINFNEEGEFVLSAKNQFTPAAVGYINSSVAIDGDYEVQLKKAATVATYKTLGSGVVTKNENGFSVEFPVIGTGTVIREEIKTFDDINAVEQRSAVVNGGKEDLTVNALCPALVIGVCGSDRPINDRLSDGSIKIRYCLSKWQSEGQWRTVTPEDAGLFFATTHSWEHCRFRTDSVSSWSTGSRYPIIIIEDLEKNESWFFESLCGINIFNEIFAYGGINGCRSLCVKIGGWDERTGFTQTLRAGESIYSGSVVYGVVKGDFESAVAELIKYKRATAKVKKTAPIVFNDYMNCNWADESRENIIPLVDKAAEIGADAFCIDDGWHDGFGLWNPNDSRFGEGGLKAIIDYIRGKNLIPGIWFEFESVCEKAKDLLGDDIYLKRKGKIVPPYRPIGDMRNKKFTDHLLSCVDRMYAMGIRYIKNDHNNVVGIGCDGEESEGYSLYKNHLAYCEFIDGLKERYPDLIIENCASGGMRSEWGTLRHCDIQSTSDQEDYLLYPSVLSGSLALMPPEKAGIWAYPYPLSFDEKMQKKSPQKGDGRFIDGRQTAFNLVSAMAGNPYLSGRIDLMDEKNLSLVKEAVKVYKSLISFKERAVPIYPTDTAKMSFKGVISLGISGEDGVLLLLWNTSDAFASRKIDLSRYALKSVKLLYPSDCDYIEFSFDGKTLGAALEPYCAAALFFERK